MTYAIYAAHSCTNSDTMPEICRVESETVAEQIAEKLRKEKFRDRMGRKAVKRFSSVVVQKITSPRG